MAKTKQTTVQTFHQLQCIFFMQFVIPQMYSHYFYFIFNDSARRQRITPTNEVETMEIASNDDVGRLQYA